MTSSITTSSDISGLTANTTYSFNLYPINAIGQRSTTYTTVSFTTLPYVKNITVDASSGSNTAIVYWYGLYTSLKIYYDTSSNPTSNTSYTSVNSTSSSLTTQHNTEITDLSSNGTYYFTIYPYSGASLTGLSGSYIQTSMITVSVFIVVLYS
jgi:hypothetical protein